MAEQNANKGYAAIKKEVTKGTAVTPDVYVPYYSQSMNTDMKLISDEPIYGTTFKRFQTLQNIRSHGGSLSVMAEPNSAARWLDMVAAKTATTGAGPYTHTYAASNTVSPNSYTLDISLGSQVVRFFGVEAGKVNFGFDDDKMVLALDDVAALGSFYGREVSTVTGSGPYTITFKTNYDASPTTGLVVGDLIQLYRISTGTYINATVATIPTATTITVTENVALGAVGDVVTLRPATPTLSLLTPFLWGRTEFRFGATAAGALSATQTRLESGSELTLSHEFEENEGARRSGAFDPAALVRTVYDLEGSVKMFFDKPEQIRYWQGIEKRSLVMRSFSGTTSEYELRVTLNNIRTMNNEIPTESEGVIYHETDIVPNYDTADGKGFEVAVINAVATV